MKMGSAATVVVGFTSAVLVTGFDVATGGRGAASTIGCTDGGTSLADSELDDL